MSFLINPYRYASVGGGGGGPTGTTWNPADKAIFITLSNGDLTATAAPSEGWQSVRAIQSRSSGIRYFELLWNGAFDTGGSGYFMVGVGGSLAILSTYMGFSATAWAWQPTQRLRWNNNSSALYGPALNLAGGSVLGVLMNFTAGTLTFYYNGSSQGTAYSSLSGTLYPMCSVYNGMDVTARFSASSWTNAPGAGETEW